MPIEQRRVQTIERRCETVNYTTVQTSKYDQKITEIIIKIEGSESLIDDVDTRYKVMLNEAIA